MLRVETIPDDDAIHRQIDFPKMYGYAKEMIWENVFQFPAGEPESVVWGKYAPSADDVHRLGYERESIARERNPCTMSGSSALQPERYDRSRPGRDPAFV